MSGHVLAAIVIALALAAGALVLLRRRGPPADPRARLPTVPAVPVWFEDPASGARFIPAERQGRLVVGAAGDVRVPGARPRHAEVRVFSRHTVDIGPVERAALELDDHRVRAPAPLREGARVRLGAVDLVAHVGWLPDPGDPRIGAVVAGERLWERLGPRRYAGERAVVELLDPPVDPAAYEARLRVATAAVPQLLRVRTVHADAIVVDGVDGVQHAGPLTPEQLVELCRLLAPLHAAGLAHGALDDAVFVAPGRLRLWPVAPSGHVSEDIKSLRARLPLLWPELEASDVRALALAVLHEGRARDAFAMWEFGPCERCREPFARRDPPQTTMFDGRDPTTGRMFGGQVTEQRSECLVCGHVDVRVEREAYS